MLGLHVVVGLPCGEDGCLRATRAIEGMPAAADALAEDRGPQPHQHKAATNKDFQNP